MIKLNPTCLNERIQIEIVRAVRARFAAVHDQPDSDVITSKLISSAIETKDGKASMELFSFSYSQLESQFYIK